MTSDPRVGERVVRLELDKGIWREARTRRQIMAAWQAEIRQTD